MLFTLKKIVSYSLSPFLLGLEILILGLFCLWATRRQRLGKLLVTLGTLFLLLVSSPYISAKLLAPLEGRYPALLHPGTISWQQAAGATAPKWIVVLGGGSVSNPRLPAVSQLRPPALARLIEGLRLYRAIPGSRLLLSGGRVFDPVPEADVMARIAVLLGVNPQDITRERTSRDTGDEAVLIAHLIGKQKFLLVTSASHLPRAMALFKKQGLNPIPAPADYQIKKTPGQRYGPRWFFPKARALEQTDTAWHEYLGLAWAWLQGLI